jgi:hypothetical protein
MNDARPVEETIETDTGKGVKYRGFLDQKMGPEKSPF